MPRNKTEGAKRKERWKKREHVRGKAPENKVKHKSMKYYTTWERAQKGHICAYFTSLQWHHFLFPLSIYYLHAHGQTDKRRWKLLAFSCLCWEKRERFEFSHLHVHYSLTIVYIHPSCSAGLAKLLPIKEKPTFPLLLSAALLTLLGFTAHK